MAHTPGPWIWTDGENPIDIATYGETKTTTYTDNPELKGSNGDFIVGCDEYWTIGPINDDDTMVANARLIAAAPDMLVALRATLAHVDDDMNNRKVVLWKLREIVVAAIAKAEGR